MKVVLADISGRMTDAWKTEFEGYSDVTIVNHSIFFEDADALVSPANSFGIMDGGIDGKIRDFFGMEIETHVRSRIADEFDGEMPVGSAIVVPTSNRQFPFLVSAPTMRVPEEVAASLNAYLAMHAVLRISLRHESINSLAVPGLCALSGRMPFHIVARQMRVAYDRLVLGRIRYSHWREEKELQYYLRCRTDTLPFDLER